MRQTLTYNTYILKSQVLLRGVGTLHLKTEWALYSSEGRCGGYGVCVCVFGAGEGGAANYALQYSADFFLSRFRARISRSQGWRKTNLVFKTEYHPSAIKSYSIHWVAYQSNVFG